MYSTLLARATAFLALWAVIASCSPAYFPEGSALPVVDLGYVKQRATVYNETNDWYIFKNIRFAAPPLGNLRFRKPQPPLPQKEIQDGNIEDPICHQAIPYSLSKVAANTSFGVEDCLFLDVYVPKKIKPTDSVPVLAWVYGGGYILGSKDLWGDPAGLINSADEPIIYVASNYRLGAFGWLSDAEEDIDINIGLYDFRAAMEWIQDYIPKFGGDNQRVTIAGESAGGGIIMSTITAYGGQHSPPPFQQAIIQSPGMFPGKKDPQGHTAIYNAFQSAANCTNLECLRQAPTEVLKDANEYLILNGLASFGPVIDDDYVPDIPMKLLVQGKFHHNLKSIITANTGFEAGYFFPSPDSITNTTFDENVTGFFRNASEFVIQRINELYPKGDEWRRTVDLFSDVIFTCNAQALAQAFGNKAYRYIFNIPPAYHGDDIPYTFYNGPGFDPLVKSDWAAVVHQEYISDYITYGMPGCGGTSPCFPTYGYDSNSLSMNLTEVKIMRDPWDNERCHFMQHEAFED